MITHECLPIEPQNGDTFLVPTGTTVHVGAFIQVRHKNNWVGEATAFDKVAVLSNLWTLQRVVIPANDAFLVLEVDMELEVHTILRSADRLIFQDGLGWVVLSYDPTPIQQTIYTGKIASLTGPVFSTESYSIFEIVGFMANKKGEKK